MPASCFDFIIASELFGLPFENRTLITRVFSGLRFRLSSWAMHQSMDHRIGTRSMITVLGMVSMQAALPDMSVSSPKPFEAIALRALVARV